MSKVLPHGELRQRQPRHRDDAYLRSFRNRACEACGKLDGTTVPAHLSIGNLARGMKAHDWLVAGLCLDCHQWADSGDMDARRDVWMRVLRALMRDRYRAWQETRR